MLTINLICMGKLKENYWRDACKEYEKRLKLFCKFSMIELAEVKLPDQPSEAQIASALNAESEKLLAVASTGIILPLCIEGKELSSTQLANKLELIAVNGESTVNFIIGSSYGLSDNVKKAGSLMLSMSCMTFPHQLARVMLCEQIYRSFQISQNGKYHK